MINSIGPCHFLADQEDHQDTIVFLLHMTLFWELKAHGKSMYFVEYCMGVIVTLLDVSEQRGEVVQ